jgi:HAD superfamily hydrolase (TIGR01484 family)
MPQDISQLDPAGVKGIFFDIDDTLTTGGKLTAEAYAALWRLNDAGKIVVPITGRPAGWCDHIARMWPVTAVIGENGAFYFTMEEGKLEKCYIWGKTSLEESRTKLDAIKGEVLASYPHAGVASDQNYREFDLAIDFCEDVARMRREEIDGIVAIFEKHGAKTKISSIHVNGWFGDYDKLKATRAFANNNLGVDLDAHNDEFVFVGDSPNDEPMFRFFANSVGVNNVMDFQDRLQHLPRFITPSRSGAGFVEVADRLLRTD